MKKRKSISKKRKRQLIILLSVVIGALLIIGALQYAGVISIFEERVLDSENEGYGHLPRRLSTSAEAQSITIVQIQSITYLSLKLTRSDPTPLSTEKVKVSIRSSLNGADLWSNTFTLAHLNIVNEANQPYIPEDAKWESLLQVSPAVSVTPGQQIFIVVQLTQTLNSDEYLSFWLDEKSDYDRYTGGCEYHMGPGTNYQWIPNYSSHTYVDHSFKVYGTSPNQPPTVPARPVGPSEGTPGTNYYHETSGSTDPEGGTVEYKWDRGDGSPSPWMTTLRSIHSWSSTGTYQIKVKARDEFGAESGWSSTTTIVISQEVQNHAPLTPSFSAWEDTLDIGEVGTWSAVSSDPDGNNIFYTWKVDGSVVRQQGFVPSGTYDSLSHTFTSTGSHTISVRVRDTPGLYSNWATRTVTVGEEAPSGYQASIFVVDSTTYGGIAGASVVCNGELKTANAQGVATYTLPVGTYTASASASGYVSDSVSITVTTSGGSAFVYLDTTGNGEEPEEPEEPEEGFYSVTVEVFNDITNLPVENAKVTANNIDKFTNSEGKAIYSLEGSGKTYSVSVIASGYNSNLKTTTVYAEPKTVSFYLTPLGNGEAPPENGEPEPEPGTPGFEFMALIVAIGAAFIYIRKKRRL